MLQTNEKDYTDPKKASKAYIIKANKIKDCAKGTYINIYI